MANPYLRFMGGGGGGDNPFADIFGEPTAPPPVTGSNIFGPRGLPNAYNPSWDIVEPPFQFSDIYPGLRTFNQPPEPQVNLPGMVPQDPSVGDWETPFVMPPDLMNMPYNIPNVTNPTFPNTGPYPWWAPNPISYDFGGGTPVPAWQEPTPIPGAEMPWENMGTDPFNQLLQEYLNDPSGFLASTGPGDVGSAVYGPNSVFEDTGPNVEPTPIPGNIDQPPEGSAQVIIPRDTSGDVPVLPATLAPGNEPTDIQGPPTLANVPGAYDPSDPGNLGYGTTKPPNKFLSDLGLDIKDIFTGLGKIPGAIGNFFSGPGYYSPDYLRSIGYTPGAAALSPGEFGQFGQHPIFSGGAFWSPPGGSIGGPLGSGSHGNIGWYGNFVLQQMARQAAKTGRAWNYATGGYMDVLPPSEWGGAHNETEQVGGRFGPNARAMAPV